MEAKFLFDNRALRQLPVEQEARNFIRQVANACFSPVRPTPLPQPRLVAASSDALALLGLPPLPEGALESRDASIAVFGKDEDTSDAPVTTTTNQSAAGTATATWLGSWGDVVATFAGNLIPPGAAPSAHCYCGYQFGSFAGQLGDGAAIYLGEVRPATTSRTEGANADDAASAQPPATAAGASEGGSSSSSSTASATCGAQSPPPPYAASWELQLKGAGETPYSRQADGRKVVRSTLREFWASEHMAALGIPTTRAAGVCVSYTGTVVRDPLYSGRPRQEHCAVVARVAPSFLRFGSFQICTEDQGRTGPSHGHPEILRTLFAFVARTYYPTIWAEAATALGATDSSGNNDQVKDAISRRAVSAVVREVTRRTAALAARWQCTGFIHGVLNTDNMSILGLTIDYGPYAFMENFFKHAVSNTSDDSGRYNYAAQPDVCLWNVLKLREALLLAFPEPSATAAAAAAADGTRGGSDQDVPNVDEIEKWYWAAYRAMRRDMIRAKLFGLPTPPAHSASPSPSATAIVSDSEVDEWDTRVFDAMHETGVDMTSAFVLLERVHDAASMPPVAAAAAAPGSDGSTLTASGGIGASAVSPWHHDALFATVVGARLPTAAPPKVATLNEPAQSRKDLIDSIVAALGGLCASRQVRLDQYVRRLRPMRTPISAEKVNELLALPDEQIVMLAAPGTPAAAIRAELAAVLERVAAYDKLDAEALVFVRDRAADAGTLLMKNRELWTGLVSDLVSFVAEKFGAAAPPQAPSLDARQAVMRQSNPRFILRQWIAQAAIEATESAHTATAEVQRAEAAVKAAAAAAATAGDDDDTGNSDTPTAGAAGRRNHAAAPSAHGKAQRLLERLRRPYAPLDEQDDAEGWIDAPAEAHNVCVSCSS